MKLIGVWAPAPQSGKSTIASMLINERHFECVPFAGTLKDMARILLLDLGYSHKEITALLRGDKKAMVREDVPVSLRYVLQTLGTEWGRRLSPDIWVKTWEGRITRASDRPWRVDGIVVDDVRFPEEVAAVRRLGGEMWSVFRPDAQPVEHASEAMTFAQVEPERIFTNDSDIDTLLQKVRAAL